MGSDGGPGSTGELWVALVTADEALATAAMDAAAIAGVVIRRVASAAARAERPTGSVSDADRRSARQAAPRLPLCVLWGLDAVGAAPPSLGAGDVLLVPAHESGRGWAVAAQRRVSAVAALPDGVDWLVQLLMDAGRPESGEAGPVLALLGGAGGLGVSSLAVAVAGWAARRGRAVLVDADPFGGGVHRAVGLDIRQGRHWGHFAAARGRLSAADVQGLPHVDGLSVLGWPEARLPDGATRMGAISGLVSAARVGAATVVVDVGSRSRHVLAELPRDSRLVVVAPNTVRGVVAAARCASDVRAAGAHELRLVVREMGGTVARRSIARAVGLPVVAVLRDDPRVAADEDGGRPPGARRGSAPRSCAAQVGAALLGEEAA